MHTAELNSPMIQHLFIMWQLDGKPTFTIFLNLWPGSEKTSPSPPCVINGWNPNKIDD